MSYKKAECILPESLLEQIQHYIDGEYLYIPRKATKRKSWGEMTQSKQETAKRNLEIYASFQQGISGKELAEMYCLSVKTIYKIIAKAKSGS